MVVGTPLTSPELPAKSNSFVPRGKATVDDLERR
jgi:hypothetical protein